MYNKANFYVRQTFICTTGLKEDGIIPHAFYMNYQDIRRIMMKDEQYVALPRKVSNHVLMALDKNWKSFFEGIKEWKKFPDKFTGRPSLPRYQDPKSGRYGLSYELGAISKKEHKKGFIKLSQTDLKIPFINKQYKLVGARIVVLPTGFYKIEIIYDKPEEPKQKNNEKYLGIDPGVNNLTTLTSNKRGIKPIEIGRAHV